MASIYGSAINTYAPTPSNVQQHIVFHMNPFVMECGIVEMVLMKETVQESVTKCINVRQ